MTSKVGKKEKRTRENKSGTIWQIGVLTEEQSIFGGLRICDLRPFRATFSVKNFGPLLCEQWSARTFGSVQYFLRFSAQKPGFGEDEVSQHPAPKHAKMRTASKPECQLANFSLKSSAKRPKSAIFLLKQRSVQLWERQLPNRTCFTRLPVSPKNDKMPTFLSIFVPNNCVPNLVLPFLGIEDFLG